MRNLIFFILVFVAGATGASAQSWDQLNDEQKLMKAKEFRADNQKYLKNTLGMTQTQLDDIDNVNVCYLSTLDRINRYAKDDAAKEKLADVLAEARSAQLDAIMGVEKRDKYMAYVKEKIGKGNK